MSDGPPMPGRSHAAAIGSGDVVIGGVGSTGTLFLNAANSIGTAAGTLTINSKYDLGASKSTNFRGGTIIINGVISGTGTSGVALASGAFGLTTGTLTLAGNNTFAGNTSVASGYTLVLKHANALGATGGTNSVASGGTMEVASGVTINSGETVSIAGVGNNFGALRAGIKRTAFLYDLCTTGQTNDYGCLFNGERPAIAGDVPVQLIITVKKTDLAGGLVKNVVGMFAGVQKYIF